MDEDLDAKLKELEKVHAAIKNLKSSGDDKKEQEKAMAAADKILKERKANETKTVLNKTKINKPADPNAGMMAALAADADKRAAERKKRIAEANRIKEGLIFFCLFLKPKKKELGNRALKEGFPAEAERRYSEALEIEKSIPAIWTNRAIVRIRLKKYKEAIEDCDWAFRASNDKCPKAMINLGNAHMALGEFEKAEEAFNKCIKLGKRELAQSYLIKLNEKKEQHEQKHKYLAEDNPHRSDYIVDITKTLLKNGGALQSYLSIISILEISLGRHKHLVYDFVDAKGMDIFKTPDGIIIENELQELWITLTPDSIAQNNVQQNDCISTMWRLFGITVRQNYPKGEEVMDDSAFPDILLGSLQSASAEIRTCCLQTIFFFSSIETLKSKLVVVFHRTDTLKTFTDAILNDDGTSISLSMQIITNLTRIGDCRRLFRDDFTNTIQPTLISVLENYDKMESETVAKVISAITNMLKDDFIRRCVVSADLIWELTCQVLAKAPAETKDDMDMFTNLLGFLHNMSFDKSKIVIENAPRVARSIERCMIIKSKNDDVLLRCIGLFNNICSKNSECCSIIINYTEKLFACLNHSRENLRQLAGRLLACMAEKSDECCLRIVKADPGLTKICKFLDSKNDSERGNASLLVSKCAPLIEPVPIHLIEPLLNIVNTSPCDHTRKNAAVAVGRLSRDSPEGRKELHRCHGLEILTARLKNVKL